jgi:galactitol-specific phosphotransferase system IIB component
MRFIRNIVLSLEDKTLRVFTNSRKAPFQYHYDTNTWELSEGDTGENLTKAVLKYCEADSIEAVVKDYSYKNYMGIFKSQLTFLDSKSALDIFTSTEDFEEQLNDTAIEPLMMTISTLKNFIDTAELEEEVKTSISRLFSKGSEVMIKKAIEDYNEDAIEFEELNRIFYKYIDYIKKENNKIGQRLDKQMDGLYKQAMKLKGNGIG